jgi:hypothetical protein
MRPIPPYSTDLLYVGDFRQEDLIETGKALGVSDLKVVTKTTQKPERILYHSCLNGIQTYVKLMHLGEAERAREIAELADTMYAKLIDSYKLKVEQSNSSLAEKERDVKRFCNNLDGIESAKPWNTVRFNNTWNSNDYPPRWQKKAIETYGNIRSRIASGEYTPRDGETAGSISQYWVLRNMEYKHYREIARGMVEYYIQQHIPESLQLTMHPADERIMTMFIGGMGSGKSEMTKYYLGQLPDDVRQDLVLHNADYLKFALYRSAFKDGLLPAGHVYSGAESQSESSNALYEGTRKRAYLARQKFAAPNVVLNSIVLGNFEISEGIASGGKVVAHHISISKEEAIKEAASRTSAGGRAPAASDVAWSTAASAKSLFLLTQPPYKGVDVIVHLYTRSASQAPVHYGTIEAAKGMLYVHDMRALAEMCHTAFPDMSKEQALKEYAEKFLSSGFTLAITRDATLSEPIAAIDSQKKLVISDIASFEQKVPYRNVLREMALSTQLGSNIQLGSVDPEGVLRAVR